MLGLDVVIVAISILLGAGLAGKVFKEKPVTEVRESIPKIKELEGE